MFVRDQVHLCHGDRDRSSPGPKIFLNYNYLINNNINWNLQYNIILYRSSSFVLNTVMHKLIIGKVLYINLWIVLYISFQFKIINFRVTI